MHTHTHTHTAPHILYNLTLGACFDCNLGRQHKQLSSSQDDDMDARNMKKTLQYHFMNPFEKWNHPTKKQFPWKLVVQLLSIILVTTQVSSVAKIMLVIYKTHTHAAGPVCELKVYRNGFHTWQQENFHTAVCDQCR